MHKKIYFVSCFCLFYLSLTAQKEGNVWFFGGGDPTYPDSAHYKSCRINFESNPVNIEFIPHVLPFTRSNSSICDKDGNFLCLSNGENIYNRDYEVMDGGGDLFPNADYFYGFPGNQGFVLLPFPNHENQLIQFYGRIQVIDPPGPSTGALAYYPRYAIIDMTANNGLGKVINKHIPVGSDTLGPGYMTATRHGNGRDWWIIINHYEKKKFYKYLLDPQGIKLFGSQEIEMKPLGLTQTVFSPDGKWYARFSMHGRLPDSTFSTIEFYPFDRCSGLLGSIQEKTYSSNPLDGKPGGVAFSASSRYMYVSRWDTIFQYDMQAPNILGSEVVVAAFDGFWGDWDNGNKVPQRFYSLMLGPDEKIYCCVSNYNSKYLHVINNPEAPGIACDVQQHSIQLPVFNEYSIPNNPYYGLGKWVGSPCDTINVVTTNDLTFSDKVIVFPNPSSGPIMLRFALPSTIQNTSLRVMDVNGRLVQRFDSLPSNGEINMTFTAPGMYFYQLVADGCLIESGKIVIQH